MPAAQAIDPHPGDPKGRESNAFQASNPAETPAIPTTGSGTAPPRLQVPTVCRPSPPSIRSIASIPPIFRDPGPNTYTRFLFDHNYHAKG